MWIKTFLDGQIIQEDRAKGKTWLKTPLVGILEVQMLNRNPEGQLIYSPVLSNCNRYWHSRTALIQEGSNPREIAERIQGQLDDGRWATITWDGKDYVSSVQKVAFGMPIV